ncbi:hypothetical protein PENTCL1PPCAC_30059 [Pristionchus entomophagus]|uniref:IRS-type PTB domain-containing protein n=1 Tax=Pristionchus entomophagus TaxID=358040 RepID=A0AAV5UNT9_9BILA|nr:hypothetical protein PENTCL1PPCAC_30059 [Pristionchus entomophagus]
MDEISFRHDEPPARLIAMQIYQESFMKKKKWRHVAGALIESSKHGRARLEIFNTEDELKVARPSKIVLLDDCLSIRVVDLQDDANRHLKLHLRDGSSVALRADNVFALRTQLSRLAFPTQFVSLNRPFSLDSPSTPPDIIPTENSLPVPVLLLQTVGSLHEGSYGLLFGEEKIELRTEDRTAGSFDYENIHWIASGDYCFGFETNRTSLLYEFKCTQPQQIIDSYRKKCKFRSYFHPTSRPTVNHYLRFYYPDTLRSGESTLSSDSKNVPSSSASSSAPRPMLRESAASPESEDIPLHQIRNVRFAPVITTEINSKPKNKIVGFFKNISPFSKNSTERSAFEQRANNEFRLTATNKKVKNETPKLATIIRYNPDTRSPRVGSSHSVERPRDMPLESIQRPDGSGVEPVYSPIPLAIASSPLDPSIQTLVSHLAPASRVSLASATPTADAARVSRVEILQSTYID